MADSGYDGLSSVTINGYTKGSNNNAVYGKKNGQRSAYFQINTNFTPTYYDWIGFYIWCSVNSWSFPIPAQTTNNVYYYIGGNKQCEDDNWRYSRAYYSQYSKTIDLSSSGSLLPQQFSVTATTSGFSLLFNNTVYFDTAVTYYYLFAWKETADS